MRKYECTGCGEHCIVSTSKKYNALMCPNTKEQWLEMKEETVTDCNQLPDWCKVGEWVCYYGDGKYEYFQITKIELNRLYGKDGYFSLMCNVKPARKRPFNAEEMKALVGKVLENHKYLFLVEGYDKDRKTILTFLRFFTAAELMDSDYLIDREPCYVLEHLENGEWVE